MERTRNGSLEDRSGQDRREFMRGGRSLTLSNSSSSFKSQSQLGLCELVGTAGDRGRTSPSVQKWACNAIDDTT